MKQKIFVLVLLFFIETNAIKCYQNQTRITETFQFTAIECPNIGITKATGCLTYTSFSTGTVTRMCDFANCTENGFNRSNSCYTSAGNATTCCCNSDACNGATTIFSPSSSLRG